jgi:hypothetical protein
LFGFKLFFDWIWQDFFHTKDAFFKGIYKRGLLNPHQRGGCRRPLCSLRERAFGALRSPLRACLWARSKNAYVPMPTAQRFLRNPPASWGSTPHPCRGFQPPHPLGWLRTQERSSKRTLGDAFFRGAGFSPSLRCGEKKTPRYSAFGARNFKVTKMGAVKCCLKIGVLV